MESIKFKIPKSLRKIIFADLKRSHEYAYERVGFILTRVYESNNDKLILAYDYCAVADEDYIDDENVGARINSNAIRKAMQVALTQKCGVFHVHLHMHLGKPTESFSDEEGIQPMMASVSRVNLHEDFGYLILSNDSAICKIYSEKKEEFFEPDIYTEIGYPMNLVFAKQVKNKKFSERQKRQTFLGENSTNVFEKINIGIIGYGGGGSHIGQQLAHIGFKNIYVFDDDSFEESNINRLVGAKYSDVKNKTKKTKIAQRSINDISPTANVIKIQKRWQEEPEALHKCDVIVGCVDSFIERQQLEAETRRYLIPLIDIGMDIYKVKDSFSISGQIILSLPGSFCMKCCGFMTEDKLAAEAKKYGDIGGNPQVVWSNGVLASNAVGIMVDLILGWSALEDRRVYLSYDGTRSLLKEHSRLIATPNDCEHFLLSEIGPPKLMEI